jgi:hypothetical protein
MLTKLVKQVFPHCTIIDAALKFPITKDGWEVDMPDEDECNFDNPEWRLVLNLQDMLTFDHDDDVPRELLTIQAFYQEWADLNRIIVVIWPVGIGNRWPQDSFHCIEFSTHQYETWESYKGSEDVLRKIFSRTNKDMQDNFVCMNRIQKPHRKITASRLDIYKTGNISLQSAGRELKYPSPSYDEYNVHYDNLINLYGLSENFNSSFFSVITESQYAEPYGIITEKTFNAIVAGHPFLMVGHKGCLDDLRSYGFKTYPMIFDEEYQHLPNADRIDHMIEMNEHWFVQKLNATDIFEWDMETSEVVDYNLNFFFDDFGNEQVSWLRKQLLNAWF